MDSKRPDVRLDEEPEEDGRVTTRDDRPSVLERVRSLLQRS
ncbi:hypothetical protein [Halovivax sp.]|nr:hypothetical protein [Halovivax sp.]